MLQNLQYFCNEKTQIIFISSKFGFFYSAQSTVHMSKIAGNEKWKKYISVGFLITKKIANFKAFNPTISSSINLLFKRSVKWHKKILFFVNYFYYYTHKVGLDNKEELSCLVKYSFSLSNIDILLATSLINSWWWILSSILLYRSTAALISGAENKFLNFFLNLFFFI